MIDVYKDVIEDGGWVFTAGNGGSASTAEHFSNDLFSCGAGAVCLNSNTSIMTMLANDFGYDQVFSKQLDVMAEPCDLLVVFSCSGTSPNILKALETANDIGMHIITYFGDGGSYEEIENEHLVICHEIKEALK